LEKYYKFPTKNIPGYAYIYNFVHHKVANNNEKYTTMETDNRETDKILTNYIAYLAYIS